MDTDTHTYIHNNRLCKNHKGMPSPFQVGEFVKILPHAHHFSGQIGRIIEYTPIDKGAYYQIKFSPYDKWQTIMAWHELEKL